MGEKMFSSDKRQGREDFGWKGADQFRREKLLQLKKTLRERKQPTRLDSWYKKFLLVGGGEGVNFQGLKGCENGTNVKGPQGKSRPAGKEQLETGKTTQGLGPAAKGNEHCGIQINSKTSRLEETQGGGAWRHGKGHKKGGGYQRAGQEPHKWETGEESIQYRKK